MTDLVSGPPPASVAGDGAEDTTPLGPIWLSHHYAGDADRCVRVGGVALCRRCLAMVAGFVPALAVLVSPWRHGIQAGDQGIVLALTIVAGIEFVQVVSGRTEYRAVRVLALSPAVGATIAWLGVTGVRDGFGPLHVVLSALAATALGLLFRHGTVVRRSR